MPNLMRRIFLTVAAVAALNLGGTAVRAQPVDARNPVFSASTPTAGIVVAPPGSTCTNLGPGTINVCGVEGVTPTIAINGTPLSGGIAIPNAPLLGGTGSTYTQITLGANAGLALGSNILSGTQFSTSAIGMVPVSPGGATQYLRADGSWTVPPGGATLPTSAPLIGSNSGGSGVAITPTNGLSVNGSSQLVPTFGTSANTIAQGNDSRIVGALQSVPAPTTSVLGGILAATAQSGQFVSFVDASGVQHFATPAGGGNVSNTGTPTSGQIAVWAGSTVVGGASAINAVPIGNTTPSTIAATSLASSLGLVDTSTAGISTGGPVTASSGVSTLAAVSTPSFNNWAPLFGLTYSATTIVNAGAGYANGDVLTLADSCATHGTLAVTANTGGVITIATVASPGSCASVPVGTLSVGSTTGSGTGATFNLKYSALASGIVNAPNDVGGNTFLAALPAAGFAGQETVLIGNNAGSQFTGSSNSNTCAGISACGGAGGTPFTGTLITGFGNDACRNLAGTMIGIDCFGAGALRNQALATSSATVIGTGAAFNENANTAPVNLAILGPAACQGLSGSAAFHDMTCVGVKNGFQLTTASFSTLIGEKVASTTFASGTGVLLIGSGYSFVDTPAANTGHYINIENIITATGTATPATSVTTLAGNLVVTGVCTGCGAGGGVQYGISDNYTQTPVTPGTGYVNGEVLTMADGCATHGTLTVQANTSGAITATVPTGRGSCANPPTNPVAVTSTTGSGTGATFNLSYGTLSAGLLFQNGANGNLLLTSTVQPGFYGTETVLAGPLAGSGLTGVSSNVTALGFGSCGGAQSGSPFTMTNSICVGSNAGKLMTTGANNDVLIGAGLLSAISGNANIAIWAGHGGSGLTSGAQNVFILGGDAITTGAGSVFEGFNSNATGVAVNDAVVIGGTSAGGGNGARGGSSSVVVGARAGNASLTGTAQTIIGFSCGQTNDTTGTNVILIGTGTACDTPSAELSNYLGLFGSGGAIISATGTNTPSTSTTTVAGNFTVTGTCTGCGGGSGITLSPLSVYANPTGSSASGASVTLGNGLVFAGTALNTNAPDTTSTGNYTITAADMAGQRNASGAGITISIPAITSTIFNQGQTASIVNTGTSPVTLSSVPTINGYTGTTIGTGGFVNVTSNGTSLDAWGFPGFGTITANALTKFSGTSGITAASSISDNGATVSIAEPVTLSGVATGTAGFVSIGAGGVLGVSAGSSGVSITDGVTTVAGATSITFSGGTVSGTAPNGTVTITGGSGSAPAVPQGRLTLTTGTPVLASDVTAAGTLYYDTFNGNQVPYWTGSIVSSDAITSGEVSTAMQTTGTGVLNTTGVFDVWWVHGGTNRICIVTNGSGGGWASDTGGSNTARGTGYSQIHNTKGFWTNVNSLTHCYNGTSDYGSVSADQGTYLGTIYTTAAGKTGMQFHPTPTAGGTANILGVFNAYNQVSFVSYELDNTSGGYSVSSTTWGPTNTSTANRITWVDGLGQTATQASTQNLAGGAGADAYLNGTAFDSITATPALTGYVNAAANATSYATTSPVPAVSTPAVGLHYAQTMEAVQATGTITVFPFSSGQYYYLILTKSM